MVLGAGYEEVTEEGVTSGFVVVQVRLTLQELPPEAMVQDGAEEVRVPDMLELVENVPSAEYPLPVVFSA